ncbi:hypothetical protein CCUG60884_00311 [Mycobacteroides salmoniphilum]|uniref:Uncharacterized protein n=1 Tax=Mycobacteroides salmoniphilum TaxID=404941 RepID=A0A4R8SZV9_9MYCO|nr:hypothetical protein CCUG60884_00311 [Mycobacteroides salmoniphilum]
MAIAHGAEWAFAAVPHISLVGPASQGKTIREQACPPDYEQARGVLSTSSRICLVLNCQWATASTPTD